MIQMTVVYQNNQTKLEKKKKDTWVLTVDWEGDTKKFWVNFPYNLLKITKQDKMGDSKKFTIKANSIKPAEWGLDYTNNNAFYVSGVKKINETIKENNIETNFIQLPNGKHNENSWNQVLDKFLIST